MTDRLTMPSPQPICNLSDDALDWQVLLHSGHASPADRERYQRWCQLSPAHAEAGREAEGLWEEIGHAPISQGQATVPEPRSKRRWAMSIAASLVLLIVGYSGWQQMPVWLADYRTAIGEQQRVTLADGSQVTLNSASALSVAFSARERRVRLQAGEALFETADDPRPFVVETAGQPVQSRAATFSVRRNGQVVLAQGSASIGGLPLAVAADAEAQTAWQRGKLIFNGKPLRQVLAELERYQHGRIVLSDSTLGALQISGVFDLNDPQALLHTLEQRYGIKVTHLPWLAVVH